MLDFLPQNIKDGLNCLNLMDVYELRLRVNAPIRVNYKGEYQYLGLFGVVGQAKNALKCTSQDIEECVYRAGKYSVYSVEEQIKQGYITAECGERIGLAGEFVFENGKPLALRNYTSLCIRVPHDVKGCGLQIYNKCMCGKVQNLLLMSPPGLGKTTILRDLGRIISEKTLKNVLICDERGEISSGEIGSTCDVMRFADKSTAFEMGVRAMRPEVIITDELSVKDCFAIARVIDAGINVLASAHFASMQTIAKEFKGIFDRYVLLSNQIIGKVVGIYNKLGEEIG
ncbi:MAG: hypothetical protein IJ308_07450 [Clostridia bacterium]|nr:hypothetical protein [Clostridia bacterium]